VDQVATVPAVTAPAIIITIKVLARRKKPNDFSWCQTNYAPALAPGRSLSLTRVRDEQSPKRNTNPKIPAVSAQPEQFVPVPSSAMRKYGKAAALARPGSSVAIIASNSASNWKFNPWRSLCVSKIRFGNIGGEDRRGPAAK